MIGDHDIAVEFREAERRAAAAAAAADAAADGAAPERPGVAAEAGPSSGVASREGSATTGAAAASQLGPGPRAEKRMADFRANPLLAEHAAKVTAPGALGQGGRAACRGARRAAGGGGGAGARGPLCAVAARGRCVSGAPLSGHAGRSAGLLQQHDPSGPLALQRPAAPRAPPSAPSSPALTRPAPLAPWLAQGRPAAAHERDAGGCGRGARDQKPGHAALPGDEPAGHAAARGADGVPFAGGRSPRAWRRAPASSYAIGAHGPAPLSAMP
jgi:hypothetical protein